MVTTTALAFSSSTDAARSAAAFVALGHLKQRPVPTEAQAEALTRLEAVHAEMRDAPKEAAAAKVAHLRNKLLAIKLAAGTATATGDLRFARSALHDIRAVTKELTQALKDAGLIKSTGVPADSQAKPAGAEAKVAPDDALGQTGEEAKGLVRDLRKVLAKLHLALVAAQIRGAGPEEIRAAEKQLRDTERDLQALSASLSAKGGGGRSLDLRA
jgi:hypothetical protein